MLTYYELFGLKVTASPLEVEMAFRHFITRYRTVADVEQLYNDPRLKRYLNAYLTLNGTLRARYNEALKQFGYFGKKLEGKEIWGDVPEFTPWDTLPGNDRRLLLARMAIWRRQMVSAVHILRSLLEREPQHAEGWALLGEAFFITDHLQDGVTAYHHALQADPYNADYQARLQQALQAIAGTGSIEIELSPEETLLHEERLRRRWAMAVGLLVGAGLLGASCHPAFHRLYPQALFIPWDGVFAQALGIFIVMLSLGFGRLIHPFERVMVLTALPVYDRGSLNNYPYGLLVLVTGAVSLWLAVTAVVILGLMDEEWPVSPTIMIGVCALANAALTMLVYIPTGAWSGQFVFGGNLLILAAMLGWWLGSLGTPSYS